MSDKRNPSPPSDWHEAFAALPLEHPPGDGWSRVAGTLAQRRPAHRRVLPWAAAAAVACLAAVPGLILLRSPVPAALPPASIGTAAVHDASPAMGREATEATPSIGDQPGSEGTTTIASASAAMAVTPALQGSISPGDTAPAQAPVDMERLYVESAHLEGLLAELSGPEPGDGVQLALTVSLRSQVADIDTALSGTQLDEPTLASLWRQRVAVLRELVGITADQRWNALYGDPSADYALVQVY